jgi:hypothetical protein
VTPIEVFQRAADFGLKLGIEPGNTLTFQPVKACPREFVPVLKGHKLQLLALLGLPCCMVRSEVLQETIFFVKDEDTKASLAQAGAEPFAIYTRQELQILIEHNRVKPFVPSELLHLHNARRAFKVLGFRR